MSTLKIGRNDQCPCLSGKKFKHCCEGKIAWEQIFRQKSTNELRKHLSVRGRNIHFFDRLLGALQFDDGPPKTLQEYKAAFTPSAVKKINEAIVDLWPSTTDINSLLGAFRADVSGLYIGQYRKELLARAINRHSLYANKILLIDPFIHPLTVRDQYNPILQPQEFRTNTLHNTNIWFSLMPWVEAGIVEFIHTPADFDRQLKWDLLKFQQEKIKNSDELKRAVKNAAKEIFTEERKHELGQRMFILSAPDEYLRRMFRKLRQGNARDEESFVASVHRLREDDPEFLLPLSETESGQFHIESTGAGYEEAKLTASLTGSYLVTDLPSRWKEIELDRRMNGVEQSEWTPLANAFHKLDLKYLENVSINHALILREEERLQSLRAFLWRVWRAASSGDPYGEENVQHLADELESKVAEAEEEWDKINRTLMKWTATEAAAGFLGAIPLIASGHADIVAAVSVIGAMANIAWAHHARSGFPRKYPAAFFMDLRKNS